MNPIIRNILIVDDEREFREVVQGYLQRLGNYDCQKASCADEGMEVLARNNCDLVISDIIMEGKDGLDFMKEAKIKHSEVDFIIMTAHPGKYDYRQIIDAGAIDFIAKPFSPWELKAKIDRLEREKRVLLELRQANERLHRIYQQIESTLEEAISALASALELRDPYTAGHQRRASGLACAMAREMALPTNSIVTLRMAGPVHDIGKIAVPSEILSKPTKLTEIENSLIKTHCQAGFDILKGINFPWPIAQVAYQHHERLDGSGYPNALRGDEILLEARILAIADVVEAMSSHRPYRPALGLEVALEEISGRSGEYYDPDAVRACMDLLTENRYFLE